MTGRFFKHSLRIPFYSKVDLCLTGRKTLDRIEGERI